MLTLGKDNAPSRLAPEYPGNEPSSIAIVAPIAVVIDGVDLSGEPRSTVRLAGVQELRHALARRAGE